MAILRMFKEKRYLFLAVAFSFLMFFLYPFLQVLPQGLNNFWFWFSLLTPQGLFLYLLYGIVFGTTLSFFLWQKSQKTCSFRKTAEGGFLGFLGSFLGVSAPLCPACLSWLVLLLPASLGFSLINYSIEITIFGIFLLFFVLWLFGAFKKPAKIIK